jgi:hypothetical protein
MAAVLCSPDTMIDRRCSESQGHGFAGGRVAHGGVTQARLPTQVPHAQAANGGLMSQCRGVDPHAHQSTPPRRAPRTFVGPREQPAPGPPPGPLGSPQARIPPRVSGRRSGLMTGTRLGFVWASANSAEMRPNLADAIGSGSARKISKRCGMSLDARSLSTSHLLRCSGRAAQAGSVSGPRRSYRGQHRCDRSTDRKGAGRQNSPFPCSEQGGA